MMNHLVSRDERESSVDHRGDRLAYLVLSFGLLAIVAYRSFAEGAASWDLLALVVLGGVVGTVYRLSQRAVSREWAIVAIGTGAIALVVGVIVMLATSA
ncbi:MAG: hypothetical protein WEG56_04030 [Chloroflexota bacterium]